MSFHMPEQYRIVSGDLRSDKGFGNNGAFAITQTIGPTLLAVASDASQWEHVSVSLQNRCPRWHEMDRIKHLFWGDDDTVMQLHLPRSSNLGNQDFCLHLWRPIDAVIPTPLSSMTDVVMTA